MPTTRDQRARARPSTRLAVAQRRVHSLRGGAPSGTCSSRNRLSGSQSPPPVDAPSIDRHTRFPMALRQGATGQPARRALQSRRLPQAPNSVPPRRPRTLRWPTATQCHSINVQRSYAVRNAGPDGVVQSIHAIRRPLEPAMRYEALRAEVRSSAPAAEPAGPARRRRFARC